MWSASDKATGPVTVIAPPHRSLRRGGAGRGAHRQPLLHQVPLVPIGGDQGRPGERGGRRRQAAARAAPPLAPPLASPSPDAHSVAALVSLQYCWVHPEKEAAIQCILCLRCKVRPGGFHAPQHWLVYGARAAAACLHQGRAASKACTAKPRGGAAAARRPPIPPPAATTLHLAARPPNTPRLLRVNHRRLRMCICSHHAGGHQEELPLLLRVPARALGLPP